ncbi:Mur ligase family protein, partial [Olsenella uli]
MRARTRLARLAGALAHWGTVNVAHRGGGNIPGAVALRVDPDVVRELGADLAPRVVVTGTNGKTTTTGLLADALASGGRDVVCNRAGNNMESGVAAALVLAGAGEKDGGRAGCFECDELYT